MAKTNTTRARVVTSLFDSATMMADMPENPFDTMPMSVPPPPPGGTSHQRLWWALPILTVSWAMLLAILVSGVIPVKRWETAPGTVSAVGPRMEFDGAQRYVPKSRIMFVTAFGTQLTALESIIGWIDPDVDVQTQRERFGDGNPVEQRRLGFQAMVGAKQIAEYVALKKLGYDVSLDYGLVLVEQLICDKEPAKDSACSVLNPGDVIESVDGTPTPTLDTLLSYMSSRIASADSPSVGKTLKVGPLLKPGDTVSLVTHELNSNADSTRRKVEVRLVASPSDPSRPIIGFVPADTRTVKVPFEVDINTASIGGPSAGLAFTLSLLDELTPGELTGGAKVAVTGTIAEDGSVGAIGALRQKTVSVKASGARVFLVPASQSEAELAEARAVGGNSLAVIPVATLEDALAALKKYGGGAVTKK
jgi:PDZ domain-containing protein